MITKRFYYHSCTVSHGHWGDCTSDRACQVGGFSTINSDSGESTNLACTFYIACKWSCWWVKVLIFFLKARLSCQTIASVSKSEKNEAVSEWLQTRARAGLGVSGMIDKFIYKQQFLYWYSLLRQYVNWILKKWTESKKDWPKQSKSTLVTVIERVV